MAGSLSERATSDMLIGPDWAMNIEICDILNHDPGQSKDAVRVIKRRIGHKNPKIQLLALTLLETIVKNCGDIVHMHVAEKDVLHKMVKIVKKKPDSHVKEKILILIDTWQEAFGGPRARYPQYYAAYQELLRAGATFPQRPERSAPVLTPPQTQPLSSYPPSLRNPDYQQEAPEISDGTDLPSLSLSDIQNARGILDVLAEMLSALDPGNREALKQEVIVDLVVQCRSYRQRVVQLVNTTADEELLEKGLALNDDLQRVLAKHDAFAAGIPVQEEKPKTLQALVDVDDAPASEEPNQRSSTNINTSNHAPLEQLLISGPTESNGATTSLALIDPNMDLLSGVDFSKPSNENSLALVPVSEPLADSASDQNILAISNMFPVNNNGTSNNAASAVDSLTDFSTLQTVPSTQLQVPNQQLQQPGPFSNGGSTQYNQGTYSQGALSNQSNASWNGQAPPGLSPQQVQAYGAEDQSGSLPPPPWETQLDQNAQMVNSQPQTTPSMQPLPGGFVGGMQPPQFAGQQPQHVQGSPYMGMYPQMQNHQMAALYSQQMLGGQLPGMNQQPFQGGPTAGYGYGQQPEGQYYDPRVAAYPYANPNELAQRMHGLTMHGNSMGVNTSSSYQMPMNSPMLQSNRPPKPEDKLFGDLVSIAKTKQNKSTSSKTGSL